MTGTTNSKTKSTLIIGVIGDVCAGKSTATAILCEILGGKVRIWDADSAVRKIQAQPEIISRIVDAFSDAVRLPDGSLNRKALAELVFSDERKLKVLTEDILKAPISESLEMAISDARKDGIQWLLLDAPTLVESGNIRHCDRIIYIAASDEVKEARALTRGWKPGEVARREARLLPAKIKKERSDIVIDNNSDALSLKAELINRLSIVREGTRND